MTKARPGRPRILCYDQRYFCRMTLWMELMVGIIMTILGLFILLLSMESLKAGDFAAVYFCSSFIVLGVALLLVYYIHYYALKISVKRQVQKLDASIKSDQDALAALARRGLQFSKFAAVRQASSTAEVDDEARQADVARADEATGEAATSTTAFVATPSSSAVVTLEAQPSVRWQQQANLDEADADENQRDGISMVGVADLNGIWESRQTTV